MCVCGSDASANVTQYFIGVESVQSMSAHWKIKDLLWTSDGHWALVKMQYVKWPIQSHISIMLRGTDLKDVPPYILKQYMRWRDKGKINLKVESTICTRLNIPFEPMATVDSTATRYVFAWFPVLSDANQYECVLEETHMPSFLRHHHDGRTYTIRRFCGIWRDMKAVPKVMIDWCAKMQSDTAIRKGVKRKFKTLVPWERVQLKDVKVLAELREPRMNRHSKRFMSDMIHSIVDGVTSRLAPWVKPYILRTMTFEERRSVQHKLIQNVANALVMNFLDIYNVILFQKWFGHEPTDDFSQALDFRSQLGDHLHGECDSGENEFIEAVRIHTNNYVTDNEIGNLQQSTKIVYALRIDIEHYRMVIGMLKDANIVVGELAHPKGTCVVSHPDDAQHWRMVADVDEVVLLRDLGKRRAMPDHVTVFRAHMWGLEEWVMLHDVCKNTSLTVSGRLDQYAHGRGQVFRDAATRLFQCSHAPCPATSDIELCETLTDEVQQRFVSSFKDKSAVPVSERRRIWMFNPKRVRTIKGKPRGIGHMMFEEDGEKPCTIPHIREERWADVVTLREWRGPILDTAALFVTANTTPFDIYCARTYTRKLYLVGENVSVPSNAGVIPARRSLRACLQNDGI